MTQESIRPARKSVVPPSSVPTRAAPTRARYVNPAVVDIEKLDRTRDAQSPNASVATLATHATKLAASVRTHADALALAKVTPEDADQLDAHEKLLREREADWQAQVARYVPGVVAAARKTVIEGNRDLYGALTTFVDDTATVAALDAIPGEDSDDAIDTGTDRLIALARKHADDLQGTEVTPSRVDEVTLSLEQFRAARAGKREGANGTTTVQAFDLESRRAWELRNRAFWALAELDRRVCKRARFRFRGDPSRRALFKAYTATARKPRKKPTG